MLLKMAQCDRSYTSYWSATVSTALFVTTFQLFNVQECRNLDTSLKVIRNDTIRLVASNSIVSMARPISCIVSEIKRDIDRKSWFIHAPPAFDASFSGSPSEYCHNVWYRKTRMIALAHSEKFENIFTRFDTVHERERRPHRQAPHDIIGRAIHSVARQKWVHVTNAAVWDKTIMKRISVIRLDSSFCDVSMIQTTAFFYRSFSSWSLRRIHTLDFYL